MALNPLLRKLVTTAATKYSGSSSKTVKPKEGRNVYRVIVPRPNEVSWVKDDGLFYREIGVHWIKPELTAKPTHVVGSEEICFGRVSGLAAAIDMAIANAFDEDTKKLFEEWKARRSIVLNVVNRDNGNSVDILELTTTTFSKLMDAALLYADNNLDIFDRETGMDVVITKSGKGLNTSYEVTVAPQIPGKPFLPVTDEQIRQAADLDAWIESNFFRPGEAEKALAYVATMAGIQVPQLGAPQTPVAALTSSGASVAGATVTSTPAPVQAAPAPQPAPVQQAPAGFDMQAEIARQAAILAAQQVAAAQQAAPVQPVAPAPVQPASAPVSATVTASTGLADLSAAEQDKLLAELNAIA